MKKRIKFFGVVFLASMMKFIYAQNETSYQVNNTPRWGPRVTAIGFNALASNFNASIGAVENTGVGFEALLTNDDGSYNTALGARSLHQNFSGNENTAIGHASLLNFIGDGATAVGFNALTNDVSGIQNTALGTFALLNNNGGNFNTASGFESLQANTTGVSNTANGTQSMRMNTTGFGNTAVGVESLFANTTGWGNVAVGVGAAVSNQAGDYNTAVGSGAMNNSNNGNFNVALGHSALWTFVVNDNTAIGAFADMTNIWTNATAVGFGALCNNSNRVWLGDAAVADVWSATGVYLSDRRFKSNVTDDEVKGLDFIRQLRPVTYNLDARKVTEHMTKNMPDSIKAKHLEKDFEPATKIRQTGFIAQEVEEAAKSSGFNFNGVHVPEHDDDTYGLSYQLFVVPLVKAVQEQQQMIEQLQAAVKDLKDQSAGDAIGNAGSAKDESRQMPGFRLEQNEPNPFTGETTIIHEVPFLLNNAVLCVYDLSGKEKFKIPVEKGESSTTINRGELESGIYIYAIIANGEMLGSKRLIISDK